MPTPIETCACATGRVSIGAVIAAATRSLRNPEKIDINFLLKQRFNQ
jgi:hypothetical protein